MITTCDRCGRTFMFKSRAKSENHSCLHSSEKFKVRKVDIKGFVFETMTIKSVVDGYYEVRVNKNGKNVWVLLDENKVHDEEYDYSKHIFDWAVNE